MSEAAEDRLLKALANAPALDWIRGTNHVAEPFVEAITDCGLQIHLRLGRYGWFTKVWDMSSRPFELVTDHVGIDDETFGALWRQSREDG